MNAKNLKKRHHLLLDHIHHTPVLTSRLLDELSGASLFFKCENFQKAGAFKIRGALSALLSLPGEQRARGVVTHSSGNFAQALALAARLTGTTAHIVMPRTAPRVKQEAVAGYGGKITLCEPTMTAREAAAGQIRSETGAVLIHPSNDLDVIMGNATAALELIKDLPGLEALFVPVGGGGLIAGSALAVQAFAPGCVVYGGEPLGADDAYRSLKSGRIEFNENPVTVADGLKTHLGDINFPIIQEGVKEIYRVSEEQIIEALKLIWERLKVVAEPSGAVALAALLANKESFQGRRVGIMISGGNVDLENLPF